MNIETETDLVMLNREWSRALKLVGVAMQQRLDAMTDYENALDYAAKVERRIVVLNQADNAQRLSELEQQRSEEIQRNMGEQGIFG